MKVALVGRSLGKLKAYGPFGGLREAVEFATALDGNARVTILEVETPEASNN